jgi:hypothetical protein
MYAAIRIRASIQETPNGSDISILDCAHQFLIDSGSDSIRDAWQEQQHSQSSDPKKPYLSGLQSRNCNVHHPRLSFLNTDYPIHACIKQ